MARQIGMVALQGCEAAVGRKDKRVEIEESMNLSEEEMNTLIGSVEAVKNAINEMADALCKAIKPIVDIMAKLFEECCERAAHKAIKHNTPYKRAFYNRVYDKRTKLHKCRNNCRKKG